MNGIVNSPKQETTRNRDPIRLVTGISSSMNENRVGNIDEAPTPISDTPIHRPVSDELALRRKNSRKSINAIKG